MLNNLFFMLIFTPSTVVSKSFFFSFLYYGRYIIDVIAFLLQMKNELIREVL